MLFSSVFRSKKSSPSTRFLPPFCITSLSQRFCWQHTCCQTRFRASCFSLPRPTDHRFPGPSRLTADPGRSLHGVGVQRHRLAEAHRLTTAPFRNGSKISRVAACPARYCPLGNARSGGSSCSPDPGPERTRPIPPSCQRGTEATPGCEDLNDQDQLWDNCVPAPTAGRGNMTRGDMMREHDRNHPQPAPCCAAPPVRSRSIQATAEPDR